MVNLCLDWQKKKRPLALDEELPLVDERETPDAAMIRTQEQQVLEQEIAALPERQRMAVESLLRGGIEQPGSSRGDRGAFESAAIADHACESHAERAHESLLMRPI